MASFAGLGWSLGQGQGSHGEPFDIFDWYPKYQSCVRYFVERAQYEGPIQILAALVNIQLPFQKYLHLASQSSAGPSAGRPSAPSGPSTGQARLSPSAQAASNNISLVPYIRRLIATGFDQEPVLHGFFGDDWAEGIGALRLQERRNYLFAAKSENWLSVKANYDMADGQAVPFLRPLANATEEEIQAAESGWSDWLAMGDWMLGPRAPPGGPAVKKEEDED